MADRLRSTEEPQGQFSEFRLVPDPDLKDLLERTARNMSPGQNTFTSVETAHIIAGQQPYKIYEIQAFSQRLRSTKIIEYTMQTLNGNSSNITAYSRGTALAVSALYWQINMLGKRPGDRKLDVVVDQILLKLGECPVANEIHAPVKKVSAAYLPSTTSGSQDQKSTELRDFYAQLSNPTAELDKIADADLRSAIGLFQDKLPNDNSPITKAKVFNILCQELNIPRDLLPNLYKRLLMDKVIDMEMNDKKGKLQQMVYFNNDGALAFAAIAWQIDQAELNSHPETYRDSISKAVRKLGTHRVAKSITPPAKRETKQVIEGSSARTLTPAQKDFIYISGVKNPDEARIWTKEFLQERLQVLPKTTDTIRLDLFPRHLARIVVAIYELTNQTYKDPELVLEDITNSGFIEASKVTINYLENYPKIKNVGQLLDTLKRAYKAAKEKTQTPEDNQASLSS